MIKKSKFISKLLLAIIALVFTLTISKIVPKDKFDPFKLELDSLWKKTTNQQQYKVDINNDMVFETILHHNINIAGHSIELHHGQTIHQLYIFENGEKFIGSYLKFADLDNNSTKELIFISAQNYIAYLNIYSYNEEKKILLPVERVKIDSVGKFNDKMDVVNNFILTNSSTIYFDLQGSYSIQPRHIYKYDYKKKKLIKNKLNGLVTPEVELVNYHNKNYLLASCVKATSNTLSPKDAEMLRTSLDKDTLAMYQKYKHLEYKYGDFSSYILLYDDSLNFAFEPIEFFAWTNITKSAIITINDEPHIVSITNSQMDEPDNRKCKLLIVCNLKGEISKQIPLPHNYTAIFSDKEKLVFYGNKTLFITDENLNAINEINNITFATGFKDINNDNKPEFIAFENNILKVYSADFKLNATYKIKQEFAPYPESNSFTTIITHKQNSFIFNSRLFYYQFNYEKNNIAIFKYPFYFMIFIVSLGFLFFIFRLNYKRLEKENLKLEQIISERTKEIESQKEEIQTQANDLVTKNKNLMELSHFKKLMTDTVIHDLKNPLNHIIGTTKDKAIRQSGFNMLNIVLNVLDINKAQTTNLNVKIEKQNLENLINSSIEQVEYLAEQKNLEFKKRIKNIISINADKELTIRILVNLLTNAIKFSPLNNKITIQVTEKNKLAQIDIIDHGKGILPENIDKIFKEYTQIEAINSGKIKSTGLGLSFCKIAAEAQNVQINVSSVPKEKTTFSLISPIISVTEKRATNTNSNKNEIMLTNEEQKQLKPILIKLKKIEIYKATEILNLLNTIENSSENIKLWKQKLTTAMYSMNDELYLKLIDNEL